MTEISQNRKDLARLFKGIGAEIGVERAVFSWHIAKTSTKLYCVDVWKAYPGFRDHVSQIDQDLFFEQAKEKMRDFNCEFVRKFSQDAVKDFVDESLDFVYIDANHRYEDVRDDIREWSKKVKRGGIVAGHDYVEKIGKDYPYGVVKAVNELNEEVTIWKGDRSPSWSYIKK
jgi:hypothetical protein